MVQGGLCCFLCRFRLRNTDDTEDDADYHGCDNNAGSDALHNPFRVHGLNGTRARKRLKVLTYGGEGENVMAKTYPWGGFANGLIPDVFLTKVRGEWFEKEAAAHLVQLEAAFTAHFGKPAIIEQGYRARGKPSDKPDVPTQWGLYNKYRVSDPLRAAYPGTSPHGYARSADFASNVDKWGTPEKIWMDANAPRFGWHPTGNDFPRREAWHYDYIPGTATASLTATPLVEEEDDMKLTAIRTPDGSIGIIDSAGLLHPISDPEEWAAYLRLGIVQKQVDGEFWLQQTDGTVWRILTERTAAAGKQLSDVRNAVLRPVKRDGKDIEQIQELANTGTLVRALLARSSVTPEQLAAAVVPLLPAAGLTQEQLVAAFKEALSAFTWKASS